MKIAVFLTGCLTALALAFMFSVDNSAGLEIMKQISPMPVFRTCDPSENVFEEGMVGMDTAGEGMKYVWNKEAQKYDGPFHTVEPGQTGYTDPLTPGGNISGFYPGCVLDLGSGGRYYFYHPIGK